MSRGKYLSLEEARQDDQLDRFAKEHPSTGNQKVFDKLFDAMAKKPAKAGRTSSKASSACCTDTRTRRGT